jgi:hypothetical protein
MARRSLGPFPKTLRWHEIVALVGTGGDSDATLKSLIAKYEALTKDEAAIRVITFLVALPVSSRSADTYRELLERFQIELLGEPHEDQLLSALDKYVPEKHLAKDAAKETIRQVCADSDSGALFNPDPWQVWRSFDGVAFCDLARLFFTKLNEQYFSGEVNAAPEEEVRRFAQESSLITRSFSARWFNACARYETPEPGSIRWYLGHCLGKVQLELERELSDWVEPAGNPWKRKKKPGPELGL